ncbi:M56 family metallopeptidase [Psychroflexus sp. ALD_RP9]|uniref:M56 family metallopeptidase n=1 Tax=Psychroflexus sp. ALD_RP9 TaxID=2777186 RepID=UPI001A8F3D43|nr:M56 family metallopeptidase [Psychroflexus sp. ALD_RP9]QSS97348.1 hypothetical protein IMZ30_01120 [Psychroflexus sp. ALD_RP9]
MELLIYFGKASLLLFLFWAIYKLVLEDETYNQLKRYYLLIGYIASLILPLIQFTRTKIIEPTTSTLIANSTLASSDISTELSTAELMLQIIDDYYLIELLLLGVALFFQLKFLRQLVRLVSQLKSAQKYTKNGIHYIASRSEDTAFSFLNYVVYNPEKLTPTELQLILKHEEAHVKLRHSLDILLAHIYTSLFWFNPIAWFYKNAITENLEFQADASATSADSLKPYQQTLFKVVEERYKHQLQHAFNQNSIKKRIIMLQKSNFKPSKNYFRLVLITPFLVAYMLLFQIETIAQVRTNNIKETKAEITKVELTYGAKTSFENLRKDIEFLKEEFGVDMSYRNDTRTEDGFIKGITLDINTNTGFSGSVTSPDLAQTPVYVYYYPNEDVKSPFGVGTGKKSESETAITYDEIKNAEKIRIDGKTYKNEELKGKYIAFDKASYNPETKTLTIKRPSQFTNEEFDDFKTFFSKLKEEKAKNFTYEFISISDEAKIMLGKYKHGEKTDLKAVSKTSSFSFDASTTENLKEISAKDLNDTEVLIINRKKFSKKELANKNIIVEQAAYDSSTKTLNIKTPEAFGEGIFDGFKQLLNKTKSIYGNELKEELHFINITKKLDALLITVNNLKIDNNPENATQNKIVENSLTKNQDVLFIVDGKKINQNEIKKIDPNKIASINVIKNPTEIKKYTSDEENYEGVILITTTDKK